MRNPDFDNRFSFSGRIARIKKAPTAYHVTISQNVAGMMPTEYCLVVPDKALTEEGFLFSEGESVFIQDATLYQKGSELRLRICRQSQMRLCADEFVLNSLSFSGQIIENKEEKNCRMIKLKQTVDGRFETTLNVLVAKSVEATLKPGEIGYIKSALLYEKDGAYRARIERSSQYSLLFSPDIVMELQRTEAKERFA